MLSYSTAALLNRGQFANTACIIIVLLEGTKVQFVLPTTIVTNNVKTWISQVIFRMKMVCLNFTWLIFFFFFFN